MARRAFDYLEDPGLLRYIFTHIVLPYKLKHNEKELIDACGGNDQYSLEILLINLAFDALCSMNIEYLAPSYSNKVEEILETLKTWIDLQKDPTIDFNKIHIALKRLPDGNSLPLYFRHQNECIIIKYLKDNENYKAIISSFGAPIHTNEFKAKTCDESFIFPMASYYIKDLQMLTSKSFVELLVFLFNNEFSVFDSNSDIKPKNCIREWIVSILSADCPNENELKPVCKKIRDFFMCKEGQRLRRSPIWTCVKVIISFLLQNMDEEVQAKFFYKAFTCSVLIELCKKIKLLKSELRLQLIQKLAKKIYKLNELNEQHKITERFLFSNLFKDINERANLAVCEVREEMDMEMALICRNSRDKQSTIEYESIIIDSKFDINFEVNDFKTGLSKPKENNQEGNRCEGFKKHGLKDLINGKVTGILSLDRPAQRFLVHDIEKNVKKSLKNFLDKEKYSGNIPEVFLKVMEDYLLLAEMYYKKNPLGESRMLLTSLRLLCSLDQIACLEFPRLLKHKIGVGTIFFQNLLLPSKSYIKYAYLLKDYIEKRNADARELSIIDEPQDPSKSFPAIFYKNYVEYQENKEMRRCKKLINKKAKRQLKDIEKEYRENYGNYTKLMHKIIAMDCKFIEIIDYKELHSDNCKNCLNNKNNNPISATYHDYNFFEEKSVKHLSSCEKCKKIIDAEKYSERQEIRDYKIFVKEDAIGKLYDIEKKYKKSYGKYFKLMGEIIAMDCKFIEIIDYKEFHSDNCKKCLNKINNITVSESSSHDYKIYEEKSMKHSESCEKCKKIIDAGKYSERKKMKDYRLLINKNAIGQLYNIEKKYRESYGKYFKLMGEIIAMDCKSIEVIYNKQLHSDNCRKCFNNKQGSESSSHEYTIYEEKYMKHSGSCKKCKKIIDVENIWTSVHEWPLTSCSFCYKNKNYILNPQKFSTKCFCQFHKRIILFELKIPLTLAKLRDVIHLFLAGVIEKTNVINIETENQNNCIWLDHGPLKDHALMHQKYTSYGPSKNLNMKSLNLRTKVHEELKLEDVFRPCRPATFLIQLNNRKRIQYNNHTFTCSFDTYNEYADFQYALSSTDHKENEVIANLKSSYNKISYSEYIKFATFRVGGNLQMLNLLDALETRGLNFSKISNYNLLIQSLWQLGVINNENSKTNSKVAKTNDEFIYPSFHAECEDIKYNEQMILTLNDYLEAFKNKWDDHRIILSIVCIVTRLMIMAPSEDFIKEYALFLRKCRSLCFEWNDNIEKNILPYKDGCKNAEAKVLTEKRFEICCAGILTYWTEKKYLSHLLNNSEDKINWLKFVSKVSENSHFFIEGTKDIKQFRFNLNIMTENTIEKVSNFLIHSRRKRISDEFLTEYVRPRYGFNILNERWDFDENNHFFSNKKSEDNGVDQIQINLDGIFFINWNPVKKLPTWIKDNSLYIEFFGSQNFDCSEESRVNTIIYKTTPITIEGHEHVFYFSKNYAEKEVCNHILIKQKILSSNGIEGEEFSLLAHTNFENLLSNHLVKNFSYWNNNQKNTIVLRNRTFQKYMKDQKSFYQIDLASKKVKDLLKNRDLISMESRIFQEFYNKIFSFMDLKANIHMYLEPNDNNKILVELLRYNLNFIVDLSEKKIKSCEFSNMIVPENQQIDTLFNIEQGLILIEPFDCNIPSKKKIIIPHGILKISKVKPHHVTEILIENLRVPEYFVYNIDEKLKILRAEESIAAWAYLAWLHAASSCVLDDPFLCQTGSSRALEILQSGNCWSSKPLCKESLFIFNKIKEISPIRKFEPCGAVAYQEIAWPEEYPSFLCLDSYAIIVQSIINDSHRLNFLYNLPYEKNPPHNTEYLEFLSKEYHRHKKPGHTLKGHFKADINKKKVKNNLNDIRDLLIQPNLINVRKIILGIYTTNYVDLKSFLLSEDKLTGIKKEGFPSTGFGDWNLLAEDLKKIFLTLYSYAVDEDTDPIFFKILLSFLIYKGAPNNYIASLQMIFNTRSQFAEIEKPDGDEYEKLQEHAFNDQEICEILNDNYSISYELYEENNMSRMIKNNKGTKNLGGIRILLIKEYNSSRLKAITNGHDAVLDAWVKPFFSLEFFKKSKDFNKECWEILNAKLELWAKNLKLINFLNEVSNKFSGICTSYNIREIQIPATNNLCNITVEFNNVKITRKFSEGNIYNEMANIYDTGKIYNDGSNLMDLVQSKSLKGEEFPIEFIQSSVITKSLLDDLKESWDIYTNENQFMFKEMTNSELCQKLNERKVHIIKKMKRIEKALNNMLTSKQYKKINNLLENSRLCQSIRPNKILGKLIKTDGTKKFNNDVIKLIGALAVVWVYEQQINRCLYYASKFYLYKNQLLRELLSTPHERFSPSKYPEWLILQLEMDITIRPIQVTVAESMINPLNSKNSITQLNMGEGKTAVIIPMIAAILAKGKTLVRIIVLRSLFNTNHNSLFLKMGGILNRRIYSFPASRDIVYSIESLKNLKKCYTECIKYKGVILTLPEHILSFQLKSIELCIKSDDEELSKNIMNISEKINFISRDIMDESDEILNAKNQLVYSIGNQSKPFGGNLRWELIQTVLKSARYLYKQIAEKFGSDSIYYQEFNDEIRYPQFRFLNANAYKPLCKKICKDLLTKNSYEIDFSELNNEQKQIIKEYILENIVTSETKQQVENILKDKSLMVVKLLRGIFTCEIFLNVMNKRWRVEYGRNFNNKNIYQAVPYRAKDVPADRAQYQHLDVLIFLTQLNYYYEGLSDEELHKVFDFLKKSSSGHSEYKTWVEFMNVNKKIGKNYKDLETINFSDKSKLIKDLYPHLKYHQLVINYWLGNFVFPKETKQFECKLSKSSWDLCDKQQGTVTGFSGTNEAKMLLPLNIEYQGISELLSTNGLLLSNILLPENNFYQAFQKNITCEQIIETISNFHLIKLFLDTGALMIELDNESIAKYWLNCRTDVEAAVFFKDNNLVVLNNKGQISAFELSTYRNSLEKCIIYLDDAHTRGTDLKIPLGTIGAVTLGKGVTKDKLMQSCMRMRMLGQGHSVSFFASYEVDRSIRSMKTLLNDHNEDICAKDILKWTIKNSSNFVHDSFLYWATQGVSFYYRSGIKQNFHSKIKENSTSNSNLLYKTYGEQLEEYELDDILKRYSEDRAKSAISSIALKNAEILKKRLDEFSVNNLNFTESIKNLIVVIRKKAENINRNTMLFEMEHECEFELEIELEQEQERIVTDLRVLNPCVYEEDANVKLFIETGQFNNYAGKYTKLSLIYENFFDRKYIQIPAWTTQVYATRDFIRTVTSSIKGEYFVKQIRWLAFSNNNKEPIVLILSSYETSLYKNLFGLKTDLFMFIPRVRKDQLRLFTSGKSDIPKNIIEQIAIMAGSQYFKTIDEQNTFLKFVGYCPIPKSDPEQLHFDSGYIQPSEFFLPRNNAFGEISEESKCFERNPGQFILDIARIRAFGHKNTFSHLFEILFKGSKPLKDD